MKDPVDSPGQPDLVSFLASTDLFGGVLPEILQPLHSELECLRLRSGETLIRQGDPGDRLYLLLHGRLRVFIEEPDGKEKAVGEVGRGEVVGEMALLSDEPRSATVRAIRDSELVSLSKSGFDRLVEMHPRATLEIAQVIVKRLRQALTSPRVVNSVRTIAVVPAYADVPIHDFAYRMVQALSQYGATVHIHRDCLRELFGKEFGSDLQTCVERGDVAAWLSEQESANRFLVYEADADFSPWTRCCLRQADRVLVVARGGDEPARSTIEAVLRRESRERIVPRQDLVILHPADCRQPGGTGRWLALREGAHHYHVREGEPRDHERVARLLTGRGVGLVLGGGGARGLAHVGVLRAFEELGVPIDLIGGTSMGAVVSAVYAMEPHHESLITMARETFANARYLRDFTLPVLSLMAGRGISGMVNKTFGNIQIEDLWLNCFCISANLSQAEVVVHRRGPLGKSVRASTSLPGLLPPVLSQLQLLVDGGVLNNLPIDVMTELVDGGKVVAVDVGAKVDLVAQEAFPEALSGWRILARRLNPFVKPMKVPNILNIIFRTTELASIQAQQNVLTRRSPDLYLRPPVSNFGLLEFESYEKIIETGYQYAKERLGEWWPGS